MRTRRRLALLLSGLLVAGSMPVLHAGGQLETVDITAATPSPIPGQLMARLVGIRWDTRAIPVQYRINATLNPIPVPAALGAPVLTVDDARAAIQRSMNQWNDIRTSFIALRISGTVANPGLAGFDMVNELTFRTSAGFGAIASSPSTSLITDITLEHGEDLDGDGDADVSNAIVAAHDVDGDGDIEFPAGFYKAGTILDNDVQFNTKDTTGYRFTVGDAALDTLARSVDINTVATHELGHSIGLSHAMTNQISNGNGDGSTMFPFIDTADPESERQQRSLSTDDVAWASYVYQEGSAAKGPAAIQAGDIPFKWVFGTIEGSIHHGVLDQPVAGASVHAVGQLTGRVVASGYSGTTQVSYNPGTGGIGVLNDPSLHILDGHYTIPVPLGAYAVGVEAVDGAPVAASSVSLTAQIGAIFGQQNFNEEFYNRRREGAVETRPGEDFPVIVLPGKRRTGTSIVTGDTFNVNSFGNLNFIGFTGSPAGRYYAVAVPASVLAAIAPGEPLAVHGIGFFTRVINASTVPAFSEALLTTGVINTDGTASVDLARPFEKVRGFIGQDGDFSPFFLKQPVKVGKAIRQGIAAGAISHVFMVLRLPTTTPFPGVSGLPPVIGLDGSGTATGLPNDAPIFGLSFVSDDGETFQQLTNFNFMFSLVLSRVP